MAVWRSVTLPMRLFLNVTLLPSWFSKTAAFPVAVPWASTSSPSNVTLSAELSSWKILFPDTPRNVTALVPVGTYWIGYEPAATCTTLPALATT